MKAENTAECECECVLACGELEAVEEKENYPFLDEIKLSKCLELTLCLYHLFPGNES